MPDENSDIPLLIGTLPMARNLTGNLELDEVRVWYHVLSAEEVKQLYDMYTM